MNFLLESSKQLMKTPQSILLCGICAVKTANSGPSSAARTHGLLVPNLCLNLQAELSRTLWRFPSLLRFLFETLLPCLFQTQLSSFGICVGLNSVY